MKVLIANLFISLTADTIQKYLTKLGHSCVSKTYYTPEDLYEDRRIDNMLLKDIKLIRPDVVFSVNFWPPLARACHKNHINYISYGYDSPQNIPKSDDMDYETNFIFMFDRAEVQEYLDKGIERVFHSPLATDVDAWDNINQGDKSFDISLVGKLYESTFPAISAKLDEYLKGFYKAIIAAQQKIYGYYMIDDLLEEEIVESTGKYIGMEDDISLLKRQLSFSLGSQITYLDRLTILRILSGAADVHLFSDPLAEDKRRLLSGVTMHDRISYEKEMPAVFKSTKINLNPTLRVIRSGIPQRALDVMGCRAFLLSSFQSELAEYFIPDEEVVMYSSYEEAYEKAVFYLEHDSIRDAISINGYEKTKSMFSYEKILSDILDAAGV